MTTITKPPATRGATLGGRPRPRPRGPLLHERAAPAVRQVLVVDVCNLGLGAMTAALFDHHGDGQVRARAVGTRRVLRLLLQLSVDLGPQRARFLTGGLLG